MDNGPEDGSCHGSPESNTPRKVQRCRGGMLGFVVGSPISRSCGRGMFPPTGQSTIGWSPTRGVTREKRENLE